MCNVHVQVYVYVQCVEMKSIWFRLLLLLLLLLITTTNQLLINYYYTTYAMTTATITISGKPTIQYAAHYKTVPDGPCGRFHSECGLSIKQFRREC